MSSKVSPIVVIGRKIINQIILMYSKIVFEFMILLNKEQVHFELLMLKATLSWSFMYQYRRHSQKLTLTKQEIGLDWSKCSLTRYWFTEIVLSTFKKIPGRLLSVAVYFAWSSSQCGLSTVNFRHRQIFRQKNNV